jgi:flagellar M-ring protein FliF
MKFVNDLFAQAQAALAAMPPANRAIAAGLLLTVVISMGLLLNTASTSSGEYLFGGRAMTAEEIDRAEFAFSQAELREWERVGNRLRIPAASKDQYLRALAEANALPRELDWATQEAIKNFSPFEHNAQREDRLAMAERQVLQQSIVSFPEVKTAYVKPAIGPRGLGGQKVVSALVVVTPHGTQNLSRMRIDSIKKMVAAAFPGLQSDQVVVTDTNAQADSGSWVDSDDPHYKAMKQFERDYEQDIYNLLDAYGPIRLAVKVKIDPTLDVNSVVTRYDGTPQTVSERTKSKTSENVRPIPAGPPGFASNGAANKPMAITPDQNQTSKSNETTEAADRVVGQEQTQTRKLGMSLERVSVSVGVPESYYERVYRREWLAKNMGKPVGDIPAMTAAEREKLKNDTRASIEQAVTAILPPLPAGDDRFKLVTVWDYLDVPQSVPVEASSTPAAMQWLAESWQTVAIVFVALFALWMVRSISRSSPAPATPDFAEGFGLTIPEVPQDELAISGEGKAEGATLEITGSHLQGQLSEMIETNPDAAANILRAWMEDERAA